MSHETANVIVSRTGTGWTVDVTAANLITNTSIKDFIVFHNGATVDVANYTKTSPTILTYTGSALGAGTTVEIRRFTDDGQISPVGYSDRLSSADYNAEVDRLHRIIAEARLNGIGGAGDFTPTLSNGAYGGTWSSDTLNGATRQAIYNKVEAMAAVDATKAPIDSPAFTGTPVTTAPTVGDASTRIPTTQWTQNEFLRKGTADTVTATHTFQNGASFTGVSPTAPTPTAGDSTPKLATTAFVQGEKASPTFTGEIRLNNPSGDSIFNFRRGGVDRVKLFIDGTNDDFYVATHNNAGAYIDNAFKITRLSGGAVETPRPFNASAGGTLSGGTWNISGAALTGVPTAPTAAVDTNTTQVATTAFIIGQSYAKLASPTFTGVPLAPTAAVDTNTTQLATTAFFVGQAGSSNPLMNGTVSVGTSLRFSRQDHVHPVDTSRAPLASPNLTGTPTTPTATVDTNTTQVASTAFVIGQAGSATPLIDVQTGSLGSSLRYARQDHAHPTFFNFFFAAERDTNVAIGTNGQITFVTESYDTGNNFNSGTWTYTVPNNGLYLFGFHGHPNVDTTMYLQANGVTNFRGRTMQSIARSSVEWIIPLTGGDTVVIRSSVAATFQSLSDWYGTRIA